MISILIPTYSEDVNPLVRALLQRADKLSSSFEIRVLNDGYPGYTPLIKELASHPKVHFTSRSTNEGRAATRQELAQAAQFKYVLFLDADVLPVKSDFLTQYMAVAAQGAQVCCGGLAYQD